MQPISWSDLWPPSADATFVPALVTATVTVFVLGAWFGRLAPQPVAAKFVAGGWMIAGMALVVAWLGVPVADTAVVPRNVGLSVALAGGLGILVMPGIVAAQRLPEMRRFYPELWPWLPAAWPRERRIAVVVAAWLVYLVGYEAVFRGVLLPLLTGALGVWPGAAVTTAVYVLAHLDRPSAETLAAIPTGFVFAALTLLTGSVLAALVLHGIIAVTNELAAVRRAGAVA